MRCKLAFFLLWSDSHHRRLLRSDNDGVLTDATWFVAFHVLGIARKAEAATSRLNTKYNTQRLCGLPQERRKDKQREHVDYPFIPLSLSVSASLSLRHTFDPACVFPISDVHRIYTYPAYVCTVATQQWLQQHMAVKHSRLNNLGPLNWLYTHIHTQAG